jgi:release factor glutamine methyltransferase
MADGRRQEQAAERREPSAVHSSSLLGALQDELAAILGGDRGGARDLIAALLDKPRFWPTANRQAAIDGPTAGKALDAARAMRGGMPLAYAVGSASFRHLTLKVDRRVLIPRPETEMLVDLALEVTGGKGMIADVGTGSGAIALALAAEGNFERVVATDLSPEALAVARENLGAIPVDRRGSVDFRQGDLCGPLAGDRFAAIVSNPPYIANPERAGLPPSVRDWEPSFALYAGDDGMDTIRRLVRDAADLLAPGGTLLVEIDANRGAVSRACAESDSRWEHSSIRLDLTGRERFLVARRGR